MSADYEPNERRELTEEEQEYLDRHSVVEVAGGGLLQWLGGWLSGPDPFKQISAAVRVASYLGTAAVAGVIGNRADSFLTAMARRMFRRDQEATRKFHSVRERWRSRQTSDPAPDSVQASAPAALTEPEAVDAALAAALTCGWSRAEVRGVRQHDDGRWLISLTVNRDWLIASVPPGDPANATITIQGHRRRRWTALIVLLRLALLLSLILIALWIAHRART